MLDNAKFILSDTKEVFTNIRPVIEEVARGELGITKNLSKVSDALDDMLLELDSVFKAKEVNTMNQMVSVALEFITAYEKRDASSTEIGNMIELHIAFSKTGILRSSNNKFVIFDTPGSNTATNDGHMEVLKEALEGFSNGIPVWVSQYEAELRSIVEENDNPVDTNSKLLVGGDDSFLAYPSLVTATTSLSGKELAYSLNFPQKAIAGLPILECAEFGRNIVTYDEVQKTGKFFELGNIFHMNRKENVEVNLAKQSFASHIGEIQGEMFKELYE